EAQRCRRVTWAKVKEGVRKKIQTKPNKMLCLQLRFQQVEFLRPLEVSPIQL
ncbi:helicase domino, partial [Biomphalaria glabrata]